MRWAVAASVVLLPLSGCLVEEGAPASPLLGFCPQWSQGPGQVDLNLDLTEGEVRFMTVMPPGADPNNLTGAGWVVNGRPLDMVRVQFSFTPDDAGVTLRAARPDGSLVGILDFREERRIVPSLALVASPAADQPWDILLTTISHTEPPAPGPVELRWTAQGALHLTGNVTFHYRVCGGDV